MKCQKHINHNKINIIEVSVTDKIKKILSNIMHFYNEKIQQLNQEKVKIETNLYNKKENNRQEKEK